MQRTSSEGLRELMGLYKEDTEDRVRCRQRVAVLLMPNIPTEVQMAVGPKYSVVKFNLWMGHGGSLEIV